MDMKKIWYLVMSAMLLPTMAAPKTILAPASQMRAAGHISGKVEIILQSMTFTEEQKKAMLEVEHRNMLALKLDKTEPALFAKIEAFLGLSTKRVERLKRESQPVIAQPVVQKTEKIVAQKPAPVAPKEIGFIAYAKKVIAAAAGYSDVRDVPGMPSVSDQREMTAAMRDKECAQNNDVAAACKHAQAVHEKVSFLVEKSKKLQQFVVAFEAHMAQRYGVSTDDMTAEILCRVFELLAYADVHSDKSLHDEVGDFLGTYNSYVGEKEQVAPEEVAVPFAHWGATILASKQAEKHIMLLISWAMDLVKHSVKQDAAFAHQYDALVERTTQAAAQLQGMDVEVDAARVGEPMYVATVCGEHVEKMILAVGSPDKLSPEQYGQAEKLVQLAEQISQLANDYDMVVRQRADSQSLKRAQEDVAQLPVDQQEVLMQELQDQMMSGNLPPEIAVAMGMAPPQKKSSKGALIGIAVGAAVVAGVLEIGGQAGKGKTEGFWGLFDKVGSPSSWAMRGGGAMKRIFSKKQEVSSPPAV